MTHEVYSKVEGGFGCACGRKFRSPVAAVGHLVQVGELEAVVGVRDAGATRVRPPRRAR